jgi:hypothetical protein
VNGNPEQQLIEDGSPLSWAFHPLYTDPVGRDDYTLLTSKDQDVHTLMAVTATSAVVHEQHSENDIAEKVPSSAALLSVLDEQYLCEADIAEKVPSSAALDSKLPSTNYVDDDDDGDEKALDDANTASSSARTKSSLSSPRSNSDMASLVEQSTIEPPPVNDGDNGMSVSEFEAKNSSETHTRRKSRGMMIGSLALSTNLSDVSTPTHTLTISSDSATRSDYSASHSGSARSGSVDEQLA